ncbi:unnamed protein product, partial [Laminaria digitata]
LSVRSRYNGSSLVLLFSICPGRGAHTGFPALCVHRAVSWCLRAVFRAMLVLPHPHRWSASTALLLYNTANALLDSASRPLRYHPSQSHTPNHPPIHPPTYPPTHPYQVIESFG